MAGIRQRAGARRSATLSRCRRAYTPTLTHLLLHAYSYTPTLFRCIGRQHLPSYPDQPHLLLHAYSNTPTLTRLLLHAYSYTPTLAARVPRAQGVQARGQVAQRVALDGPARARRYAAGVFPRTGQDARGGARGAAVREAALHAAEERRVYLYIAPLLSSFT